MSSPRENPDRRTSADLLVEIGTEELPPQTLSRLGQALGTTLAAELAGQGLVENPEISWFATPRRLGARVSGVRRQQPEALCVHHALKCIVKDGVFGLLLMNSLDIVVVDFQVVTTCALGDDPAHAEDT